MVLFKRPFIVNLGRNGANVQKLVEVVIAIECANAI